MRGSSRRVWMADLIGSPVVDAAGKQVGHVVEAHIDERYRVTSILLGRYAWAQRLRLGRLVHGSLSEVAWDRVAKFEDLRVHLK